MKITNPSNQIQNSPELLPGSHQDAKFHNAAKCGKAMCNASSIHGVIVMDPNLQRSLQGGHKGAQDASWTVKYMKKWMCSS